jgi:hypothetical protein
MPMLSQVKQCSRICVVWIRKNCLTWVARFDRLTLSKELTCGLVKLDNIQTYHKSSTCVGCDLRPASLARLHRNLLHALAVISDPHPLLVCTDSSCLSHMVGGDKRGGTRSSITTRGRQVGYRGLCWCHGWSGIVHWRKRISCLEEQADVEEEDEILEFNFDEEENNAECWSVLVRFYSSQGFSVSQAYSMSCKRHGCWDKRLYAISFMIKSFT